MTREYCQSIRAEFNAFCDFKDLQYQDKAGVWRDEPDPRFSPEWPVRIKPAPREFWIGWCPTERGPHRVFFERPIPDCEKCKFIHVREVL